MKTAAGHNASLTGHAEVTTHTVGGVVEYGTAEQAELIAIVRSMDEYEQKVLLAYAHNLLVSREARRK